MSNQFFEIKTGNFVASEKNKVNNVNLKIEKKGEIVSLLGPSGVGKTTILRTIAGLQKLSSGEIFLKDKLISSEDVHVEPEKRNIALSFQDNSLFPWCLTGTHPRDGEVDRGSKRQVAMDSIAQTRVGITKQ